MILQNGSLISTIRFKLFHIAGKVTKQAYQTRVQLVSSNVFERPFWQVLYHSQTFKLI